MHLQQTADALLLAAGGVEHRVTGVQHARVHAHEGQLADEGVGHQLECQRSELLVVVGLAGDAVVLVVLALDRRDLDRRRQEVDHGVQHALHALVLEGGAAQHRLDLVGDGALAQTGLDLLFGQIAVLEVLVHQVLVGFGRGLEHLLAPLGSLFLQVGRNVTVVELHALRGLIPDDGFHLDKVDHAFELVLGADGDDHGHGIGAQAQLHLVIDLVEVRAGTVHLVHEGQTGHVILVGLTPDGLGLRLHAAHCAVHHAGTVQHAHRTLHLDGEVDVSRGVDDVDPVFRIGKVHAFPEGGHGSGGDGDATLLLLFHPVGGGRAIMHFTQLVVHAGVIQDALGRRGFSCIDVGRNTNIPVALDGGLASHDGESLNSTLRHRTDSH